MANTVRLLPETVVAERRLGRHVDHDERSRAYDIEQLLGAGKLPTGVVEHHRHVAALQQGDLGSCFPSGTRIRMADGSERPIEQVKLLDRVVTAGGGVSRVLRTMVRDEEQGLVRLVLWGHSHLRMTDEHPVLTSRGFVMARELVEGDEVAMPRYMSAQRGAIAPEEHVLNPNHRVVRGNRWQGLPGRRGLSTSAHVLPGKIDLDPEFGRLVGLFLAEGSCDSSKVTWTYALHESDTLARETVDLLANYGVDAQLRARYSPRLVNCTGNALVGALMTDPLYRKGSETLGEPDAVEIYEKATLLDNVPGSYPPDDTGSSGLAVCKAAKQMGLLSSYRHAFSWTSALRALAQMPIIVGVSWYDSFDEPDARGFVSIGTAHRSVAGTSSSSWASTPRPARCTPSTRGAPTGASTAGSRSAGTTSSGCSPRPSRATPPSPSDD